MDTFAENEDNQGMALDSILSLFDPFGTSWGSSLSWSQSAALERIAENTRPGANIVDMAPVTRELESLGQDIHEVARVVDSMEKELALRLDAQTGVLDEQLDVLQQIAETLRNPLSTRAAERVRSATELLRHQRYERALAVADEAIEDDPNNDLAFIVAGWASFGLKQFERARDYFREARQATAETAHAEVRHMHAALLAARLTFALEGPEGALMEMVKGRPSNMPDDAPYGRAWLYDSAVYEAAAGLTLKAIDHFLRAATRNYCLRAVTDPVLSQNVEVADAINTYLVNILKHINSIKNLTALGRARAKELHAIAAAHQIDVSLLEGIPVISSDSFLVLNSLGLPELSRRDEVLGANVKRMDWAVEHHPRIDREIARERVLARAIEEAEKDRHTKLVYRGRIDAIVERQTTFRRTYSYLRAVAEKPAVVVRTYLMTDEEFTRSGFPQYSTAGLSEPLLSPILAQLPKGRPSLRTYSWSGGGASAWPDDYR